MGSLFCPRFLGTGGAEGGGGGGWLVANRWSETGCRRIPLPALQSSFRAEPAAALRLLTVGESPRDEEFDSVELAAYASLANAVLGVDEAITRN